MGSTSSDLPGGLVASEAYFPYDRLAPYQNWQRAVVAVADRRTIVPQGPPKFRFSRDARVASAGSCFAARIGERLRAVGLNYLVVEAGAEPLSARYGDIYTALQLAQLLDRALGRFEPLERAWLTPSGTLLDPFRPRSSATGYATLEALEADRRGHLDAVRSMFEQLDVFVFTLGLTEVWADRRDGAAFPSCPGRGRGYFDPDRYAWHSLDVAETTAYLGRFLTTLHEINPAAKVVLTVSPVHNAATMHPTHVVRASMECKATLKVAAESVARSHDSVDYYSSYDIIMQNLGRQQFFAADGRHVTDETADFVTSAFVQHYFGDSAPVNDNPSEHSISHAPQTYDRGNAQSVYRDCDEDVLLELISAADTPIRNGAASREVSHPAPIYFLGDSNTVIYRDRIFEVPGSGRLYLGRTLHTPALAAWMVCGSDGKLNPNVLSALVGEHVLVADGAGGWTAFEHGTNPGLKNIVDMADERKGERPPIVLCAGSFDQWRILESLGTNEILVPEDTRLGPAAATRVDPLSFEQGLVLGAAYLAPLERALRILSAAGLNVFLQSLTPPIADDEEFFRVSNIAVTCAQRYQVANLLRHMMREMCARTGTVFIDLWPYLLKNGVVDAQYLLDKSHLNVAGALFTIDAVARTADFAPAV